MGSLRQFSVNGAENLVVDQGLLVSAGVDVLGVSLGCVTGRVS